MYAQTATTTLKILMFRAGPQDLPFSVDLTRTLMPLAVVANFWMFSMALPMAMAVAMSIAMVGGMAMVTNSLLKARKMTPRFNQTFNALLATGTVLTLLQLPPFSQVAPILVKATLNPKMLENPEALNLPQGAVMLMNLLTFWSLGVTAHIYRSAINVNFGIGILVAVLVAFAVWFLMMVSGSLVGAMLG